MILGKPAPFLRAFLAAVDTAIRMYPPHHAMSATQRVWLAFCVTAVLVTNSMCWARFERASLGTYSLAALSKCESGSTKEPEAALLLDTNNKMSIGKYMFQIATVQHYVRKLYGKNIDQKTAILIALNAYPEIPVDELTRKVVFEDTGIASDWVNCSKKYGLPAKVELIKELTK